MEITGKVIAILEKRSGVSKAGKDWSSQEYVIETEGQYPRRVCFNLFGEDRINESHIQMDEYITVSFDIDAREWQGRWFTSINAYRIARAQAMDNFPPPPADPFPAQEPFSTAQPFSGNNQAPAADNSNDDLPF
ncbi:MAG: DUF3127 domain-containing protein [bacterium]